MVTRAREYTDMVNSFKAKGFTGDCEYLYVDNCKTDIADAFEAYRWFLRAAKGQFIILCHDDVVLIHDGRRELDQALAELDKIDKNWAVCGNAGGGSPGEVSVRISDPHGNNQKVGAFPKRVATLDENFIVVKAEADISLSRDLDGFHFYGTDICLIADLLGWTSYVIDFHLRHNSKGTADKSYRVIRATIMRKYSRAFRGRWVANPSTIVFIGTNRVWGSLAQSYVGVRLVHKIASRFPKIARLVFGSAFRPL